MKTNPDPPADAAELRRRAEERLQTRERTPQSAQRLVHELQVHQIELEMQNEELRLANETAETALKKYTMLYDFSPMGYFTLEHDGRICELNFTGADLLGDRRFSLINSNFKLFVSEESKVVFNKFFKDVYTTDAKESCEVMLGYDNNVLRLVYIEGVVTGDNKECLLSAVDISNFRK